MLPNAFIGKTSRPTDEELAGILGAAKPLWDELAAEMACEWSSYSPKAGWSLRLRIGKRNIVYLSPHRGSFMASFALGEKALQAARDSGLPPRVQRILAEAKHYAEGAAVRLEVKKAADLPIVRKLMAAKASH